MKAYQRLLLSVLFLFFTATYSGTVMADMPPPPPGGGHGSGGNQVPGGGAPIGEGILILCLMASAWAVKKYRNAGAQD